MASIWGRRLDTQTKSTATFGHPWLNLALKEWSCCAYKIHGSPWQWNASITNLYPEVRLSGIRFQKWPLVAARNNSSSRLRFPSLDLPHPPLLLPSGIIGVKCLKRWRGAWQLQEIRDVPVQASSFQLQFNLKILPLNGIDPRWNTFSFPGGFHFRNWRGLNSCCFIWLLILCFSWELSF